VKGDPPWLAKLKQKRDYLSQWLARFRAASRVASEVQKNLDFTDFQIRVIEARPYESAEIPLPDLDQTADSDLSYLPRAYPWLPDFDDSHLPSASAFTSTATLTVSVFLGRVGDIQSPEAKRYAARHLDELRDLQERHDRPRELRVLIERLGNRNTLERLDRALLSYQSFHNGTATRSAAANDMRTLLDGVKGDLFDAARHHQNENMTWAAMAARLAHGGSAGPQCSELIRLEATRSSLVSRLSDVMKDRDAGSLTNIDQLWLELQDHLVAVLGLVELPHGPSNRTTGHVSA